jgi:hypothetical protein
MVTSEKEISTVGLQLSVPVACPVFDGAEESEQLISILAGHVIAGAFISTILICCMQVVVFPHRSVADQVLRSIPVPLHPNNPDTLSVCATTNKFTGVQLSDATATPVKSGETESSQLIVAGGGQFNIGFSRSVIRIVCVQLALLPQASDTRQVLLKVPVPLQPRGPTSTSWCVTCRLPVAVQLSLTTGDPVTAGCIPTEQSTVIF